MPNDANPCLTKALHRFAEPQQISTKRNLTLVTVGKTEAEGGRGGNGSSTTVGGTLSLAVKVTSCNKGCETVCGDVSVSHEGL